MSFSIHEFKVDRTSPFAFKMSLSGFYEAFLGENVH